MKIYFVGDQAVENIERPDISIRCSDQVFHITETDEGILVTGMRTQNIKIMPTSSASVILQTGQRNETGREQGADAA